MAKKEETISLIDTFSEFKELKNIDRTTMVSVLDVIFSMDWTNQINSRDKLVPCYLSECFSLINPDFRIYPLPPAKAPQQLLF